MRTEDGVGLCVNHGLEHAGGFLVDLRLRDGGDLQTEDAHVKACRLRLCLRHTDARERRIEEDGVGDGAAICRCACSAAHELILYNAEIVERDVGELQAARDIAHRPYMRGARAQMLVNGDRTALRHSNARRRKIQPFDVRAAARGNEDGVRRKRLFSVRRLHDDVRSLRAVLDALHLCTHQNMDAAILCMLQDARGDFCILTRDEGRAVLYDGDVRPEVGIV